VNNHSNPIFLQRAMAWVIDLVFLKIVYITLLILITGFFLKALPAEPLVLLAISGVYLFMVFAGFLLLHMSYFTLFHALSGQTIGKMFMGIKVIAENREPVSLQSAFLRWSGYVLSFIPLAAGFLWAAVDQDQCTWHDRLAQTRVIALEIT
jgi:uncharacterized RDD family membrane protein YckC